jgi:quinolinate synthase
MKMTDLPSILRALEAMGPEVILDQDTMRRAEGPLRRMIGVK